MKKIVFILFILAFFISCKHKEPKAKPVSEPIVEEKAPPIVEEEVVVPEPEVVKPVIEVPAEDVLAYSLDELNLKGYLKHIYFDFDKYDIKEEYKNLLEENVNFLKKNPTIKIRIEGHCDERGTREYNLALGQKRAEAAKNYLIALGIDENRIDTVSFGKEKPLALCHNESCWWKNRRAHFLIISK